MVLRELESERRRRTDTASGLDQIERAGVTRREAASMAEDGLEQCEEIPLSREREADRGELLELAMPLGLLGGGAVLRNERRGMAKRATQGCQDDAWRSIGRDVAGERISGEVVGRLCLARIAQPNECGAAGERADAVAVGTGAGEERAVEENDRGPCWIEARRAGKRRYAPNFDVVLAASERRGSDGAANGRDQQWLHDVMCGTCDGPRPNDAAQRSCMKLVGVRAPSRAGAALLLL